MNTYLRKLSVDSNTSEKHKVREFIISNFKNCNKIVGLGGPKLKEYIFWCRSKGFKNIEVFENNPEVLMTQLPQINYPISLKFGDINTVDPNKQDTFYDLDYCCTIKKVREYVPKFNRNYCMTVSRRLVGSSGTLKDFFKSANETILSEKYKIDPIKHTVFTTIKGNKYIYAPYWDTSAMCCIAKIN